MLVTCANYNVGSLPTSSCIFSLNIVFCFRAHTQNSTNFWTQNRTTILNSHTRKMSIIYAVRSILIRWAITQTPVGVVITKNVDILQHRYYDLQCITALIFCLHCPKSSNIYTGPLYIICRKLLLD